MNNLNIGQVQQYEEYREWVKKVSSEEIDSRILKSWKFWISVIIAPLLVSFALKLLDKIRI